MAVHAVKSTAEALAHSHLYASSDPSQKVPKYRIPEGEWDARHAHALISDELMVEGNSRLNLATFTQTWVEPEVRLLMHPRDAEARGLKEGDAVRIVNALGEVRCNLTLGSWIRPGTVALPKGLWRRHTANGYTANVLAPDTLTDLGGGACFNDARVEVMPA